MLKPLCLLIRVSDIISVINPTFLFRCSLLYEQISSTSKEICSLQCHGAKVLIPLLLPLRLDTATSVFHHAASETREDTGETKTSLNVRRANRARGCY